MLLEKLRNKKEKAFAKYKQQDKRRLFLIFNGRLWAIMDLAKYFLFHFLSYIFGELTHPAPAVNNGLSVRRLALENLSSSAAKSLGTSPRLQQLLLFGGLC